MKTTKTGMYSIVGRPNVGKSTLANLLAGEKVAIVTPKPQTTRNRITAICTKGDTQFVFMDTPGYHKPRSKLGNYMVNVVSTSISDMDAVVLVVEPVEKIGTPEGLLIEKIREAKIPAVLVINKIDTVKKELLLAVMDEYAKTKVFDAIIPMSAMLGDGREALLDALESYAEEGPWLFPEGQTSDQPERQVVAEIIREKLLLALDKEIPHGIAVEIEKWSERDNGIIDVGAVIYCEKNSHKGIIIGKRGELLKKVGQAAREDIETFMGTKVYLETWVKVKENWRDSDFLIRNFGYE